VSEPQFCVRALRSKDGEKTRSEKFPNLAFHILDNLSFIGILFM